MSALGHDAVHVRDLGLGAAPDAELFDLAARESRVLISADTDFPALLAARGASAPSVVLWRSLERRAEAQAARLEELFQVHFEALRAGAVLVVRSGRERIRKLPIVD